MRYRSYAIKQKFSVAVTNIEADNICLGSEIIQTILLLLKTSRINSGKQRKPIKNPATQTDASVRFNTDFISGCQNTTKAIMFPILSIIDSTPNMTVKIYISGDFISVYELSHESIVQFISC